MSSKKQAWMIAIGGGGEPLPDAWVKERPELLRGWPLYGQKLPSGINRGDHFLYYAAGHKKLAGAGRFVENPTTVDHVQRVQLHVVIPTLPFAPDWEILGKPAGAIQGKAAITLSDEEYLTGLRALIGLAARPFTA